MLPLIWLVWVDLSILNFKQMLLDELTQAKLVSWWHVLLMVQYMSPSDYSGLNFKFLREVTDLKQI